MADTTIAQRDGSRGPEDQPTRELTSQSEQTERLAWRVTQVRTSDEYADEGWDLICQAVDQMIKPSRMLDVPLPRVGEPEAWIAGWYRDAQIFHTYAYNLQSSYALGRISSDQASSSASSLLHWAVQTFRPGACVLWVPVPVRPRPINITLSHYEIVARHLVWQLGQLYWNYERQFNGVR